MSDPQDLLYTNQFINANILSNEQMQNEVQYYDRFKNYIDNGLVDETHKYVDDDEYENSHVNINKTLYKRWPVNSHKNHYPMFDDFTNDVSSNKYQKEIVTKVNIDSNNRDITFYPNSNSFTVPLNKTFNNINKVIISDIVFPNINESITNVNNAIAWQYASENSLLELNIDNTIIPVPDNTRTISYSSLPNAVYSYASAGGVLPSLGNYLVYQTTVTPGFYNIESLISNIRLSTSKILHGSNYLNNNTNIVEQPYIAYPKRIGTPHLFRTNIDPLSSIVQFVNRIEEIHILAIQTFSPYNNNFIFSDIFYEKSSQYETNNYYTLDTKYIYIIVPASNDTTSQYYLNPDCIYTPNPFPLVITDLSIDVGNIDFRLINYTEFYDVQIYLQNGYIIDELESISYYKFIDTITLLRSTTTTTLQNTSVKYLRFALHLSTGTVNSKKYDPKGTVIRPSTTNNIVFSNIINGFLSQRKYDGLTPSVPLNSSIFPDEGQFQGNNIFQDGLQIIQQGIDQSSGLPIYNVIQRTLDSSSNVTFNTIDGGFNINSSFSSPGIFSDYLYIEKEVFIGRSLLYRWIFDKKDGLYVNYEFNTDNEKKRSLLHVLAWPIANQTEQLFIVIQNDGYGFVKTNYQAYVVNEQELILNQKNLKLDTSNNPYYNLKLQYYSNKYYFVNDPYIYIKIKFDSNEVIDNTDQVINSICSRNLQYNRTYIRSDLFNVNIGEDYTCITNSNPDITIYEKDQSNIFAKILLSNVPGNYDTLSSNINMNNSYMINYSNLLNDVSNVTVEIYSADLKLLRIQNNFSFSLNIHEIKNILKETLIDTKANTVVKTGWTK
jgi:hypothetical protein